MGRYTFSGMTDEARLIETMVDQSKMDRGEASFIIKHYLERCVEVWEGKMLLGYFLILERDGIRQLHGYKLCKGRTRLALRVALRFLNDEQKIYSGHREANVQVNRLLKILGFKECGRTANAVVMER